MRFGVIIAAAAALLCAGQANAARYVEFQLFGVANVQYYDPFTGQLAANLNRASLFTVSFDTQNPTAPASGVEEVLAFFNPTNGRLSTLNMPSGVYFDLFTDLTKIAVGSTFQPISATGEYGYLNCANRYRYCTDIPIPNYTISARTSDVRPAVLGATESVLFTPVPEPASWLLMIAGVGVVGAAMRRRHGKRLVPQN